MTPTAADTVKESHIGNLLLPLIILTLVAVLFVQSLDFPTGEDVGPAAVPYLWIGFSSVFCISLIVQAFFGKGKPDPVPGKIGFVILFVGWLAVYLAAIEPVGYFLSSFIFLVGSMYVLTYRNHVVIFTVSIGWLIFSYVVFAKFLFIPLPIGPLLQPFLG
ncbi:MAG: tripartite tricarboxylate transporter TctB family protein [Rhodospirillales bacterium]|nr:tripartite tricarboxylate transporter TctB family protein [Rhodospirillales bacterium]